MDKTALMRAFKVMCNETGTRMSDKCKLSAAPLMGLKPMEFMEAHVRSQQLAKETCYDGRVLEANICATRKVGARLILCLVENEEQDAGGYLHIFNALNSTSKQEDAEAMFPFNAKVAIKEPLVYCSMMQVSSPASIEFVGLAKPLKRRPLEELRKEGDRLLLKGNFVMAELYYTECIKLFMQRDKSTYGETEREVFSNRAEARLKLGRYEEAVMDAEYALKIGTQVRHFKSLCIKGKGLSALQEHELALECFNTAVKGEQSTLNTAVSGEQSTVNTTPPPPELLNDITRCETVLRQSRTGEYDISGFLLGQAHPDCSDYFGPLELKLTPDGRGRGLFLTQDVQLGDVLLVCNPTAAVSSSSHGEEEADEDLYVDLVKACINSEKRLRQIYAMADAPDMQTVSDVTPFKCNVGKVLQRPSNRVVDVERIRRVRNRVGYSWQSGGTYLPGLWASVGLLNHSCLPNASKTAVGEAVFVRAAKSLKAGEEVVVAYFDRVLAPYKHRVKNLEQLDFECKCRRCILEKENRGLLDSLPYKEGEPLGINVDDNVMELVQDIEKRIKKFSEEEKKWIRAGFPDAYMAVCMLRDPSIPSLEQVLKVFLETAPGNTYTLSRIGFLYTLSRNDQALKFMNEAVCGLHGVQPQEVVDAVTKKYTLPGLSKS